MLGTCSDTQILATGTVLGVTQHLGFLGKLPDDLLFSGRRSCSVGGIFVCGNPLSIGIADIQTLIQGVQHLEA